MKKILILTADAGFGHRSAANAIAAALENRHDPDIDFRIINLLDEPNTPSVLRNSQSDYDKLVREMPKLWEFSYESSDKRVPTQLAQIGLSAMLLRSFSTVMEEYAPDAVISTYPLYQGPATTWYFINEESWRKDELIRLPQTLKNRPTTNDHRKHIPYITVITDLTNIHLIWISLLTDLYCVGTEETKETAIKCGVPAERIAVTGIPVRPIFTDHSQSKQDLRQELGWDPEKTTILAIGSKRVTKIMEYLQIVNHSGFDVQLVMIAGGDNDLYNQMMQTHWHIPVKIYNFTKEMPKMMMASDFAITKAGGLVTSESLASGLPMMLIEVLPGQEEGNAQFIAQNKAGVLIENPIALLTTLAHWLDNDRQELESVTANAKKVGKPHASEKIAELAIKLIEQSS